MLTATDPFYIRCMKPNIHKKPNQFDVNLMATQLVLDIIDERRLTHFSLLAVLWDAGDHQSEESWVLCTAQIRKVQSKVSIISIFAGNRNLYEN